MTGPEQGESADVDRTARAVKGDKPVRSYTLERRQGEIKAVNVAAATVDLTLGGDTVVIPGVRHVSNYRPQVNDTCWVDVNGPDLLVLDRIGAFGPSVISGAATAFVDADQTRSSNTYGDLSTPGPAVTVSVSPSGRLLVQTSCFLHEDTFDSASDTGGSMGFALTGANTRAAELREASYMTLQGSFTTTSKLNFSKVTLLTGLNPGLTTITAKYANTLIDTGQGRFRYRFIWAVPL